MNEQFSKPLDQFRRTAIRAVFEDRIGQRLKSTTKKAPLAFAPYEIRTSKDMRPQQGKPTLKIPEAGQGEMSAKERQEAINAILFQCRHDPVEVLKRSKEIKELLLAPEISAINFASLESKAKCDLLRAAKAYEKELKIIEGLGGNGNRLIMPQNKDALVAAKERACEAVIEMMRTEKILEAVEKFKK